MMPYVVELLVMAIFRGLNVLRGGVIRQPGCGVIFLLWERWEAAVTPPLTAPLQSPTCNSLQPFSILNLKVVSISSIPRSYQPHIFMPHFPSRLWNPRRLWRRLSRKNDEPRQMAAPPKSPDDSLSDLSVMKNSRFLPCRILYEAGVPCVIWGEDALTAYDIPTIVFDLFLLVPDPESAARVLVSHGFKPTTPSARFYDIPQMSDNVPRLAQIPASAVHDVAGPPKADDVNAPGVILLPAKYWRYKLPRTVEEVDNFIPPLSTLLNTLIDVWIDLPDDDVLLREHISTHIGYFYLYNQDIRKPDFENRLAVENRQVHFELLRGNDSPYVSLTTKKCQEHHRNVRNQIRLGRYEPTKTTP